MGFCVIRSEEARGEAGRGQGQKFAETKPAELPVAQSTKFEFVLNVQTARALGLEVPSPIQLLADQVVE
jgi:hypothetical protein